MNGDGWLDAAAARRNADRASATYDEYAVLQARVRRQLIDRLDWIAYTPQAVLDLGCGTGHGALALAARWPDARVIAVDHSPGMLAQAAHHDTAGRCERLCADARSLPLADASVDLVFSSLMLPWCDDPDAVFAEMARVLRPRGLFTFTTLGPDTLVELRDAWRAADPGEHVIPFTDMHDIGDGLVRAGLAEPVLDVLRYTLTYPDLRALARDLRATGAGNASAGRPRGLTGRGRFAAVLRAYERHRRDGVLPASCEVIFGQAWGAIADRRPRTGGEVTIPLARIRRR
ncbi:MAG TPA: malonyl-ACP O-methyltransferase BioC [Steroidobacteraceae bacterium]|nr:malonyl-ACP O-methyltransferase BioC [Steroidobacteraceae bacterium]